MSAAAQQTIASLYLAYYGRPADPEGLANWTKALIAANGNVDSIVNAFATSPEAVERFKGDTVESRVKELYQNLFGRDPEAAGLSAWTKYINDGHATLAQAANLIMQGARNEDKQLTDKRVEAASNFTDAVQTGKLSYSGNQAAEAAKVLLAGINKDSTAEQVKTLVQHSTSLVHHASTQPEVVAKLLGKGGVDELAKSATFLKDSAKVLEAITQVASQAKGDVKQVEKLLGSTTSLLDKLDDHLAKGTDLAKVIETVKSTGLDGLGKVLDTAVTPPVTGGGSSTPAPQFAPKFDTLWDGASWAGFRFTESDGKTIVPLQNNLGDVAKLKAAVKISYDGKTFEELAEKDSVYISKDGELVVKFESYPQKDFALNVAANALKISNGAVNSVSFGSKLADYTAPAAAKIEITGAEGGLNALEAGESVAVKMTAAEDASTIKVYLNNSELVAVDSKYSFDGSKLADGKHTLRVDSKDAAGNTRVNTQEFTVDKTAPAAAPTVAAGTNSGEIEVTIGNDATTAKLYDGTTDITGNFDVVATGTKVTFTPKANTVEYSAKDITAKAADAAGNLSVASTPLTYTYDNKAPAAAPTVAAGTNSGEIEVTIGNDATTAKLYDGTTDITGNFDVVATGTKVTFTPKANTVEYSAKAITAKAADDAGNLSAVSATPLSYTYDNKAPATAPTVAAGTNPGVIEVTIGNDATTAKLYDGNTDITDNFLVAVNGTKVTFTPMANTVEYSAKAITAKAADDAGNLSVASTPLTYTYDNKAPAFTTADISGLNKVVTLSFGEAVSAVDSNTLKDAVKFLETGTTFAALGEKDKVEIVGGKLVVTFDTAKQGSGTKIQVAANSLEDAAGNKVVEITTSEIAAKYTLVNASALADDAITFGTTEVNKFVTKFGEVSPATDSLSTLAALDVITGFRVGTDKVDLQTAQGGIVTDPTSLTRIADVDGTAGGFDLGGALATAFGSITSGQAGLVVVNGGADAGTYLFANDGDMTFSETADVFIKLTGLNLAAAAGNSALNASDYFI